MAESTKNMTVGAGNASASVTATVTDRMPGVPCPATPGYTYTGMRYVPVFADPAEWSSANSYEPLEIVIHEGNSYTSKTFVPVGIDISNEDFWALTGNYNAQVEQYRQEVKSFDGRITENAANIAKNAKDIGSLMPLKHSRDFKGSNIVFVSDSWGVAKYGVTKPYMELMGDILGANVTNLSVGSTGFLAGGVNSFMNRLAAWATANPSLVETVDYVMVCGSSNDYGSASSDIIAAVTQFSNYVLSKFKNAQLVLVPQFAGRLPAYASVSTNDDNLWRKTNTAMVAAYYANVFPRTRLINGTFWALRMTHESFMQDDNVHPTQQGHNYLAKWISQALTGANPGSAIMANGWGADWKVKSLDDSGKLVEEFTASSATLIKTNSQMMFTSDGQLRGNMTFTIKPSKPASTVVVESGSFVCLNSSSKLGYGWAGVIDIGGESGYAPASLGIADSKGKTVESDGAYSWLVFAGFYNKLVAGALLQIVANFSNLLGYPSAG